ncbi:PD-(D/E)XK nuclease family protein [Candidatus Sulfurimonas marisnigri]|uniref:PD-(D/E)XK nuclease family protein n=1 Tax=Candidatus Sulfurimonas marisnigri TaxID=2740405 RepID=A0A7S7RQD1_9BACT|nr:PD-(D/E)XK nuclease family protein [Candidatus Sulfurimonas marisnigri]QOY54494.1 PD-(D/E)XK nuclease family protein [Candidatus Sulfurimonas marisnigri]
MNNSTIVLPSARAIRAEQMAIENSTLFLPNFITMSDFISKLCIVKDFKTLDADSRVLLLLEASDFNAFTKLQIQRNFFTFTKNSSYIFKFFEELSAELYDIKRLDTSDIYGEYEEHITILQELYKRYELLCSERKLLDKIFLAKLYNFNEAYAKTHKNIILHVDGHLTNFELELLQKCCEFSTVHVVFNTTKFNSKMQSKFLELGIVLEEGFEYKISLNESRIVSSHKQEQNKNVTCESFSETMLQVAFVQKKIYDFIKSGHKPENIAVILPDEKFAPMLKAFDEKSNFNFAMGEPFNKTKIYEKLDSTCKFIDQDSKENEARLERVGDEFYMLLRSIYYKKSHEVDILVFLREYKERFSNKKEIKIFDEELYSFKNILPYMREMGVKSLLSVFLQRLASRTMDDVRGGKITVMGVLETRSVRFDAVVIVDFSDSNVPKKSDKDMFLNTSIREMANLPTMSDRENLQKHYYEMLIIRSKEVAISFVKSSDSSGSRFLKQLGIKEKTLHVESGYANILFEKKTTSAKEEEEIKLEYSFKNQKLSATRLKNFLTCKRKYYYRYIKHIYGHEIPKDMPKEFEIGLDVHEALKELYTKKSSYSNVDELKKNLHVELDDACGESELEKYLIAIQKRNLDKFCEEEVKRFADGWEVYKCEESMECTFAGITLAGQIDRIDKRANEIFVLDYKTGKYPLYTEKNFTEATDFQLEFYYLLAGGLGNVVGCGYYDLKESKIVNEAFLQEKLAVLESNIKDLLNIEDVNFEKCEDLKNCLFCDYKVMCGRE